MTAPARRHLHLVDEHGEVVPSVELERLQARVEELEGKLKDAELDLRVKRGQITKLKNDRAQARLVHKDRDRIEAIHSYWQRRMGTTGSLSPDRFDAVAGILDQMEIGTEQAMGKTVRFRRPKYEFPDDFKRAIDGCWDDHFVKVRKNGSEQHYTDLELICRDGKNFEEYIARCPARTEEALARAREARDTSGRVPASPLTRRRSESSEVQNARSSAWVVGGQSGLAFGRFAVTFPHVRGGLVFGHEGAPAVCP